MFSGIIEERAQVVKFLKTSQGARLTVQSERASKDTKIGDSISVNGVCLTVVEIKGKNISFDVMEETIERSNLSEISPGDIVNLERSLKVGDRISGHFVTGHVDCIGKVRTITKRPNEYAMDIEFPNVLRSYLAEKGSVAIEGVSLTVAGLNDNRLRVHLIPFTLKTTNLGAKKIGDSVNIEFDIVSKYQQGIPPSKTSKVTSEFLKKHGFL